MNINFRDRDMGLAVDRFPALDFSRNPDYRVSYTDGLRGMWRPTIRMRVWAHIMHLRAWLRRH